MTFAIIAKLRFNEGESDFFEYNFIKIEEVNMSLNIELNIVRIFWVLFLLQTLNAQEISYKVDDGGYQKGASVYVEPTQKVHLKFRVNNPKHIKWYQIIPDTSKFYKNANHPWEENAYKWVGYGKIDYKKVEIKPFRDKQEVEITHEILEANRPSNTNFYNAQLGSFWFEVEATLKNGKVIRSRGIREVERKGLSPKVFRLSYMADQSYVGYLTTFFNVPGIFGSMPYQSRNYIGVDCADVLVAASKVMNKQANTKNYNVSMLVDKLKIKAKFKIVDGKPNKQLQWGADFNVGDFIAVQGSEGSRFYHIGMLYKDENGDNILDENDSILNAGPESLHKTLVKSGAFRGSVVILENRDAI